MSDPVRAWLDEVQVAIGRLFVAGLAHPPLDLPPTLGLLAARAEVVGTDEAARRLGALAEQLEGLCPGPPQREVRTERAERLFREAMELVAWLKLFRGRYDLERAGTLQIVEDDEPDDLPRYTGRMRVDGAHLDGDRLVISGRDDDDQPLHAIDILADLDRDDPFGRPVISRLFQRSLELGTLLDATLELDGHPVGIARRGRVLRPAFRSVPTIRPADPRPPDEETLVVRWADGVKTSDPELRLTPLLDFNLTKLLLWEPRRTLSVLIQRGRTENRLIRANDGDGACLPALDARCWTVPPVELARWVEGADTWTRAAASLYGAGEGTASGWRGAWLASRTRRALPEAPPLEGQGIDLYHAVWHRFLRDQPLPVGLLEGPLAAGAVQGDPFATCARVMVLHRKDPELAADTLDAHLDAVSIDDPTSTWLVFAETRERLGGVFALDLPMHLQRLRWVRTLRAFRMGEAADGLGDVLAWGALADWRPTVVDP